MIGDWDDFVRSHREQIEEAWDEAARLREQLSASLAREHALARELEQYQSTVTRGGPPVATDDSWRNKEAPRITESEQSAPALRGGSNV